MLVMREGSGLREMLAPDECGRRDFLLFLRGLTEVLGLII
jgi:hypothetical protein